MKRIEVPFEERFKQHLQDAKEGENLLEGNVQGPGTELFENALALIHTWSDIVLKAVLHHKKCRIVIDYDTAQARTDIRVYTPKSELSDSHQEGSNS